MIFDKNIHIICQKFIQIIYHYFVLDFILLNISLSLFEN